MPIFTSQLKKLDDLSTQDAIKSIASYIRTMQDELEYRLSVLDSSNISEIDADVTNIMVEGSSINAKVKDYDSGLSQTVRLDPDGITITNAQGDKLVIDGGQIYAQNLNLTGAITFGDLDASTQAMVSATGIDATTANTMITNRLVSSPTIMGAKICTYENQNIYTQMVSHGMSVYHNDNANPKAVLGVSSDETVVHLILGSGDNAGGSTSNRLYLQKEANLAGLYYFPEDSTEPVGFTFADGAIQVHGVLAGVSGAVFA